MVTRKKAESVSKIKKKEPVDSQIETLSENMTSKEVMAFPQRTVTNIVVAASLVILVLLFFVVRLEFDLHSMRVQLYQTNQKSLDPDEAINQLVAQVGQLMTLPQGEEPAVATVTDPSQLQGQAFFANAAVGDKVLIYQKAQEAILYRPSTNKIIEVAPVAENTGSTSNTALNQSKK